MAICYTIRAQRNGVLFFVEIGCVISMYTWEGSIPRRAAKFFHDIWGVEWGTGSQCALWSAITKQSECSFSGVISGNDDIGFRIQERMKTIDFFWIVLQKPILYRDPGVLYACNIQPFLASLFCWRTTAPCGSQQAGRRMRDETKRSVLCDSCRKNPLWDGLQ